MESDKKEVMEVVLGTRRVCKVTKGGTDLSFSVLVIAGNGQGKIGVASCNHREVVGARQRASRLAKSKMVRVPLKESRTLHHDVQGKHGATTVIMRSAKPGTGIVAGKVLYPLCKLLGITDVVTKIYGSSSPHNVTLAAMNAFEMADTPRTLARRLRRRVDEIVARRNKS